MVARVEQLRLPCEPLDKLEHVVQRCIATLGDFLFPTSCVSVLRGLSAPAYRLADSHLTCSIFDLF